MRRDVGRHPDGDTGSAVDQEVGKPSRQDLRLLGRFVVVGPEVDGVGVDVAQHLRRQTTEAGLGVVTDEAVGEKGMVVAVDPDRVDGLHSGGSDRLDLGVKVVAADERLDDIAHFLGPDPLEDRDATIGLVIRAISEGRHRLALGSQIVAYQRLGVLFRQVLEL